ncbi:DUF2271 domain-containing protein [Sphingomonas psychrotolerans]|uniref:DUF2271 domain-containing protein n=1 Tax=Sphingomonas psychrotolerans TaxID=1327635 RepID=A0ABU3N4I6_9SPHN|nr:DUF2271 domain-containing protein [Sphingomonas psychrotolerans]MDT8759439.1 DUF2271 domain-containing protein [Sphingomonas psychrotolerans]
MQIRLTGLTVTAFGASTLVAAPAAAQTLDLTITIPKLNVAEYHRPYVAVWLEKEGVTPRTIQVWYDVDKAGGEGTKWLRDVRQWWRASGRSMSFPADGVTGATRAPGVQKVRLIGGRGGMPTLSPGNYTLIVEAAREVGGRELVRLPFAWNGSAAKAAGKGSTELGGVSLSLKR